MLFSQVAECFAEIEAEPSRIAMSSKIAGLLGKCSAEEARKLVYIIEGSIAPAYEGLEVGIGEKLAIKAIAQTTGYLEKDIEKEYKLVGDLGSVAEKLIAKKAQLSLSSSQNTLDKAYGAFVRIAKLGGAGSQQAKISLLAELLNGAQPAEAKYLVRFCLGKLRLGVGDPTIIDALSMMRHGDKRESEQLLRAFNLCSDLGEVAERYILGKNLSDFSARPFKPIRPALAERLSSAEEIIEKIGRCAAEAKYDGLRMQVHLEGKRVEIYSRKLEKMTHMFPEIVDAAKRLGANAAIFEGEALAYSQKEKRYLSFQETIQRKRKYGIEAMAKEFPLRLFAFDLMYKDGKDLTLEPYHKRRSMLEELVRGNGTIVASEQIIAESPQMLDQYFKRLVDAGLEGIIAKDLNQPYVAGARKFAWIKLKKSYGQMADTIDAVVVGYYLGKGARQEFEFGGLLACVKNAESGELETVAKIGSGFSEEEMRSFEDMLSKIKVSQKPAGVVSKLEPDFWVEPKYVVAVAADEITLSPMHTCGLSGGKGYALRFPRMVGMRHDKSPDDITTTAEIIRMFEIQKRRQETQAE
ncbi:MAG: ATP-dependent DNA ligase [Candidatus Micrarchaeota archaeon]|nr:ATP-dependent DNA ligase [Candidatus Micrarchaeota archaeon]